MDIVSNVTNEILFIGLLFKNPDKFVDCSHNIRSQYDFYDEATRFFYDSAETIYKTRSRKLDKNTVSAFMLEDQERLQFYKKCGGYSTIEAWMRLSEDSGYDSYFNILKKYSLLREYQRNGFDIEKIVKHPKFELFSPADIYKLIRSKADRINTIILTTEVAEVLNQNIRNTLLHCMEKPDLGINIPFPIMNDVIRGLKRKSVMATGMLSNAGKTRYMMKIVAYITLVLKEKALVLLNEMTIEEVRYALITTVINNEEFQELHGIQIKKPERELTLGKYKDANDKFIEPYKDEWGDMTETIEEYAERVAANSYEFVKIMEIADWIDKETSDLIYTKDIAAAYDDKSLEFEIRKANITHGINYFFYDTFKADKSATGDWSLMKNTCTTLTELAKELNMFGYLSIQLTDDANYIKPEELNSSVISNCKAIKHVLHTLFLFKEIPSSSFHKYKYQPIRKVWGAAKLMELDKDKRYYCCVTDKNRFGSKPKLLFEVDLNLNIWTEVGLLVY